MTRHFDTLTGIIRCKLVRGGSLLVISCLLAGCSGSDQVSTSVGGGANTGVGGTTSGGTLPSGGMVASGGLSGLGTGGQASSGGVTTIGSTAAGGVANTGGMNASTGGSQPTQTTFTTGGTSSSTTRTTGGNKATGGMVSTGGAKTSGGAGATGGAKASGGAAATGGSTATGGASTGGTTPTHSGPWKLMMLGDSITATTCYPQLVYGNLRSAGHTNFSFVGSVVNNQGCSVSGLPAGGLLTEGHSAHLVVTDTSNGSVQSWLNANPPDIVVMHFATNDVWGNGSTTTANNVLSAYTTILNQLRSVNPNAIVFVAQIIPVNPSPCSAGSPCNYEATLDALIPAWAGSHSSAASPVIAVNLETLYNNGYFPNSQYTTDGVHPNLTGSQPMGSAVAAAIIARGLF